MLLIIIITKIPQICSSIACSEVKIVAHIRLSRSPNYRENTGVIGNQTSALTVADRTFCFRSMKILIINSTILYWKTWLDINQHLLAFFLYDHYHWFRKGLGVVVWNLSTILEFREIKVYYTWRVRSANPWQKFWSPVISLSSLSSPAVQSSHRLFIRKKRLLQNVPWTTILTPATVNSVSLF